MPFYLWLVFLLHPWLGLLGLAGALILVGLTMLTGVQGPGSDPVGITQRLGAPQPSARPGAATPRPSRARHAGTTVAPWSGSTNKYLSDQLGAPMWPPPTGRSPRCCVWCCNRRVLGLGAYLVIIGQATAGVMIAASILVARALAPIEIAIANWRGFLAARQSAGRLANAVGTAAAARRQR